MVSCMAEVPACVAVFPEGGVMASRAAQELANYALDLETQADALERMAAAKRGSNEAEREAMMCRSEAARVRREIERWQ